MPESSVAGSVRHLQTLYSTVVGVGIAVAMARVVRVNGSAEVDWRALPVLSAYLVTLVPFYHGAQRHLDKHYATDASPAAQRPGLLLGDFTILFVESSVLFALAAFMAQPTAFGWSLTMLLALDTIWGVVFHGYSGSSPRFMWSRINLTHRDPELTWAKINALAIAVLVAILLPLQLAGSNPLGERVPLGSVLLVVAAGRTVADYKCAWDFYFPNGDLPKAPVP